jgi:hypothetical protein
MMSDYERDYEIAYHWSPCTRREAIAREGLKVGAPPCVNAEEFGEGHRNLWVSVSPTPSQAWYLSAGALYVGGFPTESDHWDLYEVDIKGLEVERRRDDYPELYVYDNIPAHAVRRVAFRRFDDQIIEELL